VKEGLLVILGGGVGAFARWQLGGWVLHHSGSMRFPLSTFLVNVLGCLLCGVLAGLGERQNWLTADMRLLLFTGLLGGFTTFSAFGLELTTLLRRGDVAIALAYSTLSVVVGVTALWASLAVAGGGR
jgi:CrcB protein